MELTKKAVLTLDVDEVAEACNLYAAEKVLGYRVDDVKVRWAKKVVEVTLVRADEDEEKG